jgi:hypothetical protein
MIRFIASRPTNSGHTVFLIKSWYSADQKMRTMMNKSSIRKTFTIVFRIRFLNAIFFWEFSNKLHTHYYSSSTSITLQWLQNPFSNIFKLCVSTSIKISEPASAKRAETSSSSQTNHDKDNFQTFCHAFPLHFVNISCFALYGTHVVNSN